MKNNYDDIINTPRWNPKKHPRMSMESRNAQFAPFAALTGYEDAVKETARLTDAKLELDEHCFYVDMEYILLPLKYVNTFIYLDYNIYRYFMHII